MGIFLCLIKHKLPWLAEARQHIGLTEIAGKQHNSTIGNWLIRFKMWWTDV
ncbi:hypothetical protein [Kingella kingae]|uniref:hypothetical protein n=1 Tax=Kingella kingae TaxID=504 RepID=UPI00041BAF61|nr:hypothetical protein [Kingella kingae]